MGERKLKTGKKKKVAKLMMSSIKSENKKMDTTTTIKAAAKQQPCAKTGELKWSVQGEVQANQTLPEAKSLYDGLNWRMRNYFKLVCIASVLF